MGQYTNMAEDLQLDLSSITQEQPEPLNIADFAKDVDIEIKSAKPLTGKQYLLVIPITKFFRVMRHLYILMNILNGQSIISLRLIEYFVVNYVLENNTYYNKSGYTAIPEYVINHLFSAPEPGEARAAVNNNFDDYFMVHDNYKCQLKEYNKKNFDPFCRWHRIRLYYDKNKFFYTTVAQLNFFKWAIENHVLDYILENLATIEKSMNEYERAIKKEKKIRKLNSELAVAVPMASPLAQPSITQVAGAAVGSPLTPISMLDKKTKLKGRKKKEFTKTNRSILKYECSKIIEFD